MKEKKIVRYTTEEIKEMIRRAPYFRGHFRWVRAIENQIVG